MRPLLKAPAARAPFGTPASVDPHRLVTLPPTMQKEGILLLFEMGQTMRQVQARTGLGVGTIRHILANNKPFRRDEGDAGAAHA